MKNAHFSPVRCGGRSGSGPGLTSGLEFVGSIRVGLGGSKHVKMGDEIVIFLGRAWVFECAPNSAERWNSPTHSVHKVRSRPKNELTIDVAIDSDIGNDTKAGKTKAAAQRQVQSPS